MKITVYIILCLCSCTCLAQDADLDLIRLSRRVPANTLGEKQIDQINSLSSDSEYLSPQRTYEKSNNDNENERRQRLQQESISYRIVSDNNKENNGRNPSIKTVKLELHLDEKPTITTSTKDENDREEYHNYYKIQKEDVQREERKQEDLSSLDSDTDGSSIEGAVSYAMPPESFLNSYRQQKEFLINNYHLFEKNGQFANPKQQVQYFSSPSSVGPSESGGHEPSDIRAQNQKRTSGTTNVQVISPPSHSNYYSNQENRVQYLSTSQQFPEVSGSPGSYESSPTSNVQKQSLNQQQPYDNFIPQGQSSNVRYVSSPGPTVQFVSTPTPASHFINQISQHKPAESISQYVSTPAPNSIQATIAPNNFYVSTPTHFVSTPSPIQYSTSGPVYGSRINNYHNQHNNRIEKQMQIDHFDNAVSGVRSPKYSPGNIISSTTPGPIVISSTSSPNNQEKSNVNWRSSVNSDYNDNYQPQSHSQNNYHSQPTAVNNIQYQSQQLAGNTYQSQATPISAFQSQQTPISNFQSQATPLNNFQSPTSINNFQSPTPLNNLQSSISTNNFQSQPTPINNFHSQPTPINNYQQRSTPINNIQQQPTPVNNYHSPSPSTQSQEHRNQNKNSIYNGDRESQYNQQDQRQHSYARSQSIPNQYIQRDTLFANEMEAANNLMINALHQNYMGEKQHIMKTTYQRDIEKDTELAPSNSYSNYGWKLSPKRGSIEIANEPQESFGDNSPGVYRFSTPLNDVTSAQTVVTQQSPRPVMEYRPYPDNPFLNHIAFATTSPPLNSGSIQTINFQPDNNQQQNVNVGYSIGFGNQAESGRNNNKNEHIYSNKYPFNDNIQTFTTVSSSPITNQGDIIKGVPVSPVSVPDQSYLQKHLGDRNNFVQNEILKTANSKHLTFTSPSNQIPYENTYKSSQISKQSEVPSSGKLYQYFINTPATKSTNILSSYHGNDESKNQNPNYRWSSVIGAGVEVSSSPNVEIMKQVIRESPSPNSIIFLNRDSTVDGTSGGNSYFYPPQKENNNKIVQNFDHENALKNIQPIGLSNVVSQSSTLGANAVVTISPHYPIEQSLGNDIDAFTQNQVQATPNSFSSPQAVDSTVGNPFNNYKLFDKEKVDFNHNSFKPRDSINPDSTELRSYIFGNSNDAKMYESSLNFPNHRQSDDSRSVHYLYKNSPPDSRFHSANTENRQIEYTPSETFRQHVSKNNYHSYKNEQNQPQYNKIISDDQSIQKSPNNFLFSNEQVASTRYGNPMYFNQNIGVYKAEPSAAASESSYQLISSSNKRHGNEDGYEHSKDMNSDDKIMTIHGMKVANPYNIDLKVLSDFLQGKPAIDESKLEKLRNIHPVQLDTSLIRDLVARNEKVRYEFNKNVPESRNEKVSNEISKGASIESRDLPHFEHLRSPRRKNVGSDIPTVPEKSKSFQPQSSDYDSLNDDPVFTQSDLRDHFHNAFGSHHIGAVIDQPIGFVPNHRSSEEPSAPELDDVGRFSEESEYMENHKEKSSEPSRRPVKIHSEKRHHEKRLNTDTPYPLLQPPRPSTPQRGQKKSDRRPVVPHKPRFNKVSKSSRDEGEEVDKKRMVQTELRPPPVLIIKTSG